MESAECVELEWEVGNMVDSGSDAYTLSCCNRCFWLPEEIVVDDEVKVEVAVLD